MNEFEEGEEFISFIPDEEFQQAIEEGLDEKQKAKLNELKKKKEEEPELFSMDEILAELDDNDLKHSVGSVVGSIYWLWNRKKSLCYSD